MRYVVPFIFAIFLGCLPLPAQEQLADAFRLQQQGQYGQAANLTKQLIDDGRVKGVELGSRN
jgi:hypothetical protein